MKMNQTPQPNLHLATTEQLLDELRNRYLNQTTNSDVIETIEEDKSPVIVARYKKNCEICHHPVVPNQDLIAKDFQLNKWVHEECLFTESQDL